MTKARIIIIGAGLGGLTAAIGLHQRGFQVDVFEQAPQLLELGAGISLSQSALGVYRAMGLIDQINAISLLTVDMAFLHYCTGNLLAGSYDYSDGSGTSDAPLASRHLHRADLHSLLRTTFEHLAPGALHLDHRLTAIQQDDGRVRAYFASDAAVTGDVIIGADGLKSEVRKQLWGADTVRFTGQIAYRFLVSAANAAPFMKFGRAALFQGPGRVFSRYTISGGKTVNCVAIVKSDTWQMEGWRTPATRIEVLDAFSEWHPDVIGLIENAGDLIKWGLFDREPLAQWSSDKVTLLGDAAHPMLPFLGLGAAMAIEDAMVLACVIAESDDFASAFARYEAVRRPRTSEVRRRSHDQGELIQSGNPDNFSTKSPPSHDPRFYTNNPGVDTI